MTKADADVLREVRPALKPLIKTLFDLRLRTVDACSRKGVHGGRPQDCPVCDVWYALSRAGDLVEAAADRLDDALSRSGPLQERRNES